MKKRKLTKALRKEHFPESTIPDPLHKRIQEYISIKGIGDIVIECADNIMRHYLYCKSGNEWQQETANRSINFLFDEMDKKGHVDSLVYKAIELGELLKCREMWGTCQYAKDCWVTRRGFCERQEDKDRRKKI